MTVMELAGIEALPGPGGTGRRGGRNVMAFRFPMHAAHCTVLLRHTEKRLPGLGQETRGLMPPASDRRRQRLHMQSVPRS